jgi:hypothetical protein
MQSNAIKTFSFYHSLILKINNPDLAISAIFGPIKRYYLAKCPFFQDF